MIITKADNTISSQVFSGGIAEEFVASCSRSGTSVFGRDIRQAFPNVPESGICRD